MIEVIPFMEASQGMPSFIINKYNSRITSKTVSTTLGPTRMDKVIEPYGLREIPSCV